MIGSYVKLSIRELFAFRASFALETLTKLMDTALFLIFWGVVLSSGADLGPWSVYDIILLIALSELYMAVFELIFVGFYVLPIYVVNGKLDDILILPVNPFVAVVGDQLKAARFARLVVAITLLTISIAIHPTLSPVLLLVGFIIAVIGLILNNFIMACFNLLSFWVGKMGYIVNIISITDDALYFPLSRLKGLVQAFFVLGLPIYFVSTFPLQVMTRKISTVQVLDGLAVLGALVLVWALIFRRLWVMGFRKYQSAGGL